MTSTSFPSSANGVAANGHANRHGSSFSGNPASRESLTENRPARAQTRSIIERSASNTGTTPQQLIDEPAIFYAVSSALQETQSMIAADDVSRITTALVCFHNESLTRAQTLAAFRRYERLRPFAAKIPYDRVETEYDQITRSGRKPEPAKRAYTDATNAERLAWQHSDKIRYSSTWGKWVAWDEKRWQVDDNGALTRLIIETFRTMRFEAAQIPDRESSKRLYDHAIKSEAKNRIAATESIARAILPLPIDHREFNKDPWLLNFKNGTVDLRTGKLREHRREDFITQIIPYDYPLNDERPKAFLSFLRDIFDKDSTLIAFMHRLLGSILVGEQVEHIFPIFYGTGSNGKSTLVGILLKAFGDYGMALGEDYLVQSKSSRHSTEVMDLYQKRLVVQAETDEGARLNESRVKQQTGNDKIRGRRLHNESWEYDPSHTLILETNYRPRITGTDEGIWRRVMMIPFSKFISDDEKDSQLPAKLEAEIPAILRWLVAGCLAWQREGLCAPESVVAATEKYRDESDLFAKFIDECCAREVGSEVMVSRLYAAYNAWAMQRGEKSIGQTRVDERMKKLNIEKKRKRTGQWYQGIQLAQ